MRLCCGLSFPVGGTQRDVKPPGTLKEQQCHCAMIQDADAVTLGCMQGCPDEGHWGPHLASGFLSIGTRSCLIPPTGCTSTHPMGRSPRPQSWTESHSTPRTMYTRPPSWLLTTVCPTVTHVLALWAREWVLVGVGGQQHPEGSLCRQP